MLSLGFCEHGIIGDNEFQPVVEFCLKKGPNPKVLFTITADRKLTSDHSSISCVDEIFASILGFTGSPNNNNDQSDYEFQGQKGDKVTLTLEADSSIRHISNQATLSIRDQSSGNLLNESSNGELLIEIKVTLLETMKYTISVTNSSVNKDISLAGDYVLKVYSSSGLIDEIPPKSTVE